MIRVLVPYNDFEQSAECFSRGMLGEVRLGALKVLSILHEYGSRGPFPVHNPIVEMWRGYEVALCVYAHFLNQKYAEDPRIDEGIVTGYKLQLVKHNSFIQQALDDDPAQVTSRDPSWMGREDILAADRSELLRDDFAYYHLMFPDVPLDVPPAWCLLRQNA